MIQNKFSISSLFFSLALCSVLVVGVGCKGKKKIVDTTPQESSAAEQQMAKVKSALMALLNADYTSIRQVEDAERELAEIKGMGIGDTEIASLILDVEDKLARERERLSKKDAEAKAKAEKDAFNNNLNSLFNDIASASSTNIANMKIEEALNMFSSRDALVLIAISQENGKKDYDRPTTITKYLNYLKDQKKNPNMIDKINFDAQGKIKELELTKSN
ncbi:MAG: hypothetical protein KDD63_19275 [Bacteroidetes bacterium]|nr:hypothetical protein [Bacteroidota bacterium]MCB0842709.1 hypothetical protein [Bacteroidota bacterium]MCB0854376.1 hypothetical protein [Bacteroidota bacterium]